MKDSSIPRDWISFFLLELILADKSMQEAVPIFCDVIKRIGQYSRRSVVTLFALFLKMQVEIVGELFPHLIEFSGLDTQSILNDIFSRILRNGNEMKIYDTNEIEKESGDENRFEKENSNVGRNIAVESLQRNNQQSIDPIYTKSYFSSFLHLNISNEEFESCFRTWAESQFLAIDLFILGRSEIFYRRIQKLEYYLGVSSLDEKQIIPLVMNHINDSNDRFLSSRQALTVSSLIFPIIFIVLGSVLSY